jgi:uncharacterized repeat protein (TIGR01451 family)
MRRFASDVATVLWALTAAAALLVLMAPPLFGAGTHAAMRYVLTPGTELPTITQTPSQPTPTDTPAPPTTGPTQVPPPPEEEEEEDEPTPTPDLALSKQADRSTAAVGEEVSFTITIINRGPTAAADVVAVDEVPAGMDIVGVQTTRGDVAQDGRRVTVTIGELAPGETVTIVIRARLNADVTAAELVNSVSVGGLSSSAVVSLVQPTPTLTPVPRSAPLPQNLPRTGALFADVFDAALPLALAAGALFCLSMAVRTYRR